MNHWLKSRIPHFLHLDEFILMCISDANHNKFLRNDGVWFSREDIHRVDLNIEGHFYEYGYEEGLTFLRNLGYTEYYEEGHGTGPVLKRL